MTQRMTKITIIGLTMVCLLSVAGQLFPGCSDIITAAIGAVAAITGLHNIGRGVEDGMTKFKAVSNGKGTGTQ